MLKHSLTLMLFIFASFAARAQGVMDSIFIVPDSMVTLSLDEFYAIILKNHPVVQQANLLDEVARQELRIARGAFDPKIEMQWNTKEFDDKTYYDKVDGYIAFPTWFPVNPKVGLERNRGELLNSENVIPNERQVYAGVSVPLGRGLFTDVHRATVRQAEIFQDMAVAEQVKAINKILLDAAKDYWQWYYTYYQFRLLNQSTGIASEIFRRTKLNFSMGEASAIDTVQAKITLQTRLVERQEALLQFQNTAIILSNYLWDEELNPIRLLQAAPVLTENDRQRLTNQTLEELTQLASENHPELMKIRLKLDQLTIERRLASEFLKPRLDLSYYALGAPGELSNLSLRDDYKIGLDFSFPLFLRKERGKLAQTRLKILTTEFEQQQTEREILNEIRQAYNTIQNTTILLTQETEIVLLYSRLLEAELFNLENGESDLFRITIQQERLIQSQSKLLKLQSTYEKQKALLYWAAGIRNLGLSN